MPTPKRDKEAIAQRLQELLTQLREAGARNSKSDLQLLQSIHDHAMTLGANCAEPDTDDSSGEASTWKPQGELLVERACRFLDEPKLQEAAATSYPILLISPGRGSSGFYSADVLKKAAESNVFAAG